MLCASCFNVAHLDQRRPSAFQYGWGSFAVAVLIEVLAPTCKSSRRTAPHRTTPSPSLHILILLPNG